MLSFVFVCIPYMAACTPLVFSRLVILSDKWRYHACCLFREEKMSTWHSFHSIQMFLIWALLCLWLWSLLILRAFESNGSNHFGWCLSTEEDPESEKERCPWARETDGLESSCLLSTRTWVHWKTHRKSVVSVHTCSPVTERCEGWIPVSLLGRRWEIR